METKVKGFVYKKTNFKDNDCMINVLTSDDQCIAFKARGLLKINSKNSASCNYFTISEFVLSHKTEFSNKTLKSSSLEKQFHLPYSDLLVSSVFFIIYEIVSQVCDQIKMYKKTIQVFEWLENNIDSISILNHFLKFVCNELGYKPSLSGCVSCNRKSNLVSFDFSSGGFICSSCFDDKVNQKYSSSFLKQLYDFLKTDDLYIFDKVYGVMILDMYVDFLKNNVGIYLNSYEFLKKVL